MRSDRTCQPRDWDIESSEKSSLALLGFPDRGCFLYSAISNPVNTTRFDESGWEVALRN